MSFDSSRLRLLSSNIFYLQTYRVPVSTTRVLHFKTVVLSLCGVLVKMSKPVDLERISEDDLKLFLDSFDYVLSDCDGVLWHTHAFPGVGDFFKRIKKLGKHVSFVSNNSLRSHEMYKSLFESAEIENGIDHLTYPSIAIADYLKTIDFKKKIFSVSDSQIRKTLETMGFHCKEGPLFGEGFYTEYIKYMEDDPEIGAVVFDGDFQVNLPKLYMASTYLQRPDVIYIAGATDRHVPLSVGVKAIGVGYFTDIVSEQVNRKPILLAKPGKPYAEYIMKKTGITDPKRVLFIGDMIAQDIAFGKVAGFTTLLVLSSYNYEEMMAEKTLRPDYYATSLNHIAPKLL